MKFKYTIEGIDCPNCAAKLARLMEQTDGIISAKINFISEKLAVESDLAEAQLLDTLRKCARAFDSSITIE